MPTVQRAFIMADRVYSPVHVKMLVLNWEMEITHINESHTPIVNNPRGSGFHFDRVIIFKRIIVTVFLSICKAIAFNPLGPIDAYMRQWINHHLFG